MQKRFQAQFTALDSRYKALRDPGAYPVGLSAELIKLQNETVHKVKLKELGES